MSMKSLIAILSFFLIMQSALAQPLRPAKRHSFKVHFKASYFEEKTTVWLTDSKVDLHSTPSFSGSLAFDLQIFKGLYFVGEGEYIGFEEPDPTDFTLNDPVESVVNYRASLMYDMIDLDIFNRIMWYFTFEKDHLISYAVNQTNQTITAQEIDVINGNFFLMLKGSSFGGFDHYIGLGTTLYNKPDIEGDPEIDYKKYMVKIRLVFGAMESIGIDFDYNYITTEDESGNEESHQRVWAGLYLGF